MNTDNLLYATHDDNEPSWRDQAYARGFNRFEREAPEEQEETDTEEE